MIRQFTRICWLAEIAPRGPSPIIGAGQYIPFMMAAIRLRDRHRSRCAQGLSGNWANDASR